MALRVLRAGVPTRISPSKDFVFTSLLLPLCCVSRPFPGRPSSLPPRTLLGYSSILVFARSTCPRATLQISKSQPMLDYFSLGHRRLWAGSSQHFHRQNVDHTAPAGNVSLRSGYSSPHSSFGTNRHNARLAARQQLVRPLLHACAPSRRRHELGIRPVAAPARAAAEQQLAVRRHVAVHGPETTARRGRRERWCGERRAAAEEGEGGERER